MLISKSLTLISQNIKSSELKTILSLLQNTILVINIVELVISRSI